MCIFSIARILVVVPLVVAGCRGGSSARPPTTDGPPIGMQLLEKDPALKGHPFNGLLHFETPGDSVFVATSPTPRIGSEQAHTGRSALKLAPGTRRVTLKLFAAAGRELVGEWPLVGPYLYSKEPVSVTVGYDLRGGRRLLQRRVDVPANEWKSAMLDVSSLDPNRSAVEGAMVLDFDQPISAPVWIDDVVLLDNTQTFVDTGRNGWTIRRQGHRFIIDRPLSFNLGLTTAEAAANGWTIEEANALRGRFSSPGPTKLITVYYDGRAMWDGAYRGLSVRARDDATLAAAHAAPADISVPAELGKADRNTEGDRDNDGYNESTGVYRVRASGPRIEITLNPGAIPLTRPLVQIAGLPEGKTVVTMDGQLIDRTIRLKNGDVLIELPSRVMRSTTLSAVVRVE